jgi:sugar phosphate isomerase/epimerase
MNAPVMQQVLVSLSSYGASEVRRHGQAAFARIAFDAGADGVEVRGELLQDARTELPRIRALAGDARLVYSSPEGLWGEGGLDDRAISHSIDAAVLLGASRVKMAIGAFDVRNAASVHALARFADAGVELVIENDQTDTAGTLDALLSFYAAADGAGFAPGLTFDIGNWHWTGECPLGAATSLAARVVYVHCKGVQRLPARWVAVPLADSAASWRSVLRALPKGLPWAIEYPLAGDDLVEVTRREIAVLRAASARLESGG